MEASQYRKMLRESSVKLVNARDEKLSELQAILGNAHSAHSKDGTTELYTHKSCSEDYSTDTEDALWWNVMDVVFKCCPIGGHFVWKSKGKWLQQRDTQLESPFNNALDIPRPRLAISFTRESFLGEDDSAPTQEDMEGRISPFGGDACFPFLFLKLEKDSEIERASLTNLHIASQALYNMYIVMSGAGMEESCFKHVRVFSIVIRPHDFTVRVHRIIKNENDKPSFTFDELPTQSISTKAQFYLHLDTLLNVFASRELHSRLLEAYMAAISLEKLKVQLRRDARKVRNSNFDALL